MRLDDLFSSMEGQSNSLNRDLHLNPVSTQVFYDPDSAWNRRGSDLVEIFVRRVDYRGQIVGDSHPRRWFFWRSSFVPRVGWSIDERVVGSEGGDDPGWCEFMAELDEQKRIMSALADEFNERRARYLLDWDIGIYGGVIIDAAVDRVVEDLRSENRLPSEVDFIAEEIESVLDHVESAHFDNGNLLVGRAVVCYFAEIEEENAARYVRSGNGVASGSKEGVILRAIKYRADFYLM
jgi:hypothetical protein